MQVVLFPENLTARAPELVGNLCVARTGEWIGVQDLYNSVRTGEPVDIRLASQDELRRAEAYVLLHEAGIHIARSIELLLGDVPQEVLVQKVTAVRDVIESIDMPLPAILDGMGT